MNGAIATFTGKLFRPLDPDPSMVDVLDIAHALSMICRFGGHCQRFYSVAEHSVLVGQKVGIHGLLHDAAEAYLLDLPTPLKDLMPEYKKAEAILLRCIYRALGVSWPDRDMSDRVSLADHRMLATEIDAIHVHNIRLRVPPYDDVVIRGWPPQEAEARFLAMFWHD